MLIPVKKVHSSAQNNARVLNNAQTQNNARVLNNAQAQNNTQFGMLTSVSAQGLLTGFYGIPSQDYQYNMNVCLLMFTMATTEEGCLVQGGAQIREGGVY